MKFEDYMIYIIENYVNNEIENLEDYIKQEEKLVYYDTSNDKEYLYFLDNLTIEDYNNILNDIIYNTNLADKIFDTIQEYLYKYKSEKGV